MKRSSLLSAAAKAANPAGARAGADADSAAGADSAADFAAPGGKAGLTGLKAEDRRLWAQVAQTVRPLGRRLAAGGRARAGESGGGQSEAAAAAGAEAKAAVAAGRAAEISAAGAAAENTAKKLTVRPEPGSEILRALRQKMLAEQAEKARQQARARIHSAANAAASGAALAAPGRQSNAAALAKAQTGGGFGGSSVAAIDKASAPAAPAVKAPAKAKAAPLRGGLDAGAYRRLARGRLPIEARLDLHNYTQTEAHDALLYFIRRAYAGGKRHVLIITGKGLTSGSEGILRGRLPYWLAQPPFRSYVAAMESAARAHGGEGAFYVRLRRLALGPAD